MQWNRFAAVVSVAPVASGEQLRGVLKSTARLDARRLHQIMQDGDKSR